MAAAANLAWTVEAWTRSERCILSAVGDSLHESAAGEHALPSCVDSINGPSNIADMASVYIAGANEPRDVVAAVAVEPGSGAGDYDSRGHDE